MYILFEKAFEKSQFISLNLLCSVFVLQVVSNAVMTQELTLKFALLFWMYTSYFNLYFDSNRLFFWYLRQVTSIREKNEVCVKENVLSASKK